MRHHLARIARADSTCQHEMPDEKSGPAICGYTFGPGPVAQNVCSFSTAAGSLTHGALPLSHTPRRACAVFSVAFQILDAESVKVREED